jgi:hypothetical protein
VCLFLSALCRTSSARARLGGVVVDRGVCGGTPIFPQGMALRPEECTKLTGPSVAITIEIC